MTELDFDELDKAVTSIMSGVDTSKRKEGFDDPEDKVVEIPASTDAPTSSPSAPPVITDADNDTVVASPETKPVQETRPSEPLAVKRRGQFMDVMHPSSDMKTTVAPRREGVSLQPSQPFVASSPIATPEEEPMVAASAQAPVIDIVTPLDVEPATSEKPNDEPAQQSTEQSWPDPINVAETSEVKKDTDGDGITDDSTKDSDEVPEEVVNEVAGPEAEQPIMSPFLADAKVEKRPLGATTPFPESVATPDVPQSSPVATPSEPLPEELNTDVMALESSNTSSAKPSSDESKADTQTESPKLSIPGSIPQQYTEQPSTSNVSNAAIYDTSTHHQPLDNGVQKPSPMKWVILALVLLIVGALAGAAYFYFQTQ